MITPQDVFERLVKRKRHWLEGPPRVSLSGEEGEFGTLSFVFPAGDVVEMGVYLYDRGHVLVQAEEAIERSKELADQLMMFEMTT